MVHKLAQFVDFRSHEDVIRLREVGWQRVRDLLLRCLVKWEISPVWRVVIVPAKAGSVLAFVDRACRLLDMPVGAVVLRFLQLHAEVAEAGGRAVSAVVAVGLSRCTELLHWFANVSIGQVNRRLRHWLALREQRGLRQILGGCIHAIRRCVDGKPLPV